MIHLHQEFHMTKKVEEVLKKLFEDKDMCQKSDDDCKEINPKQSVRKLFSTKKGGNTSPIVVTKTPLGYTVPRRKEKKTPSKLDGPSIPKWLSLMFQPKRRMELNEEECNLAIYIFGCPPNEEIGKKEIIAASNYWAHHVTRKLLLELKPNKFVTGDVIDLAACMLTYDARKEMRQPKTWFLPTTLTRYVLSWNSPFWQMKQFYQKEFMGNADVVSKIFLPIYDHLHWFLLVIDFVRKELVYLDSYQSSSVLHGRISSIKKLAMFMEEFLMDPSFHGTDSNYDYKITKFKIVTPKGLGRQGDGSNDCAVWVINWMMQRGENGYKIEVDEGSRLKIALQLTLHPFNDKRDLMLAKSLEHKQDFIKGYDSEVY